MVQGPFVERASISNEYICCHVVTRHLCVLCATRAGSPRGGRVTGQFPPGRSNRGCKRAQLGSSSGTECTLRLLSLVSAQVIITVCRCIVLQRELIMPGHVITLVSTRCDWTRQVIFYNLLLPGKRQIILKFGTSPLLCCQQRWCLKL